MKFKPDRFDYLIITGGLVNAAIIAMLVGYWLLH